ncbi:stage II sporulation protein M [Paenibacillus oenotherae]|uniref:Stage II sporulation protein M n=1 Tax=Paenibacillus oenotherae TaxID=1435645 RepID=A0ABS7DCN2_9BACL|nr:stage II sporulation protein M [Paenibacillus oenotherae]MBW7477519.1 stage II sporulation protein M [Paenibacillus oenotherae]
MFAIREIFGHLKEMRHYIIFSAVVMLAGMVVGATNPALDSFVQGQLSGLRDVAETLESKDNSAVWFMVFIFFNNAIKSILVMYIGSLFGIVPIIFLAVNGMVIGYIINIAAEEGQLFTLIVKGLLPHGILEIPAILIACAYGIRFGKMMFTGLGAMVTRRKGWGQELESFVARTLPAMVLIVVMLLIASIIESTVTVWLLQM